MPILYKISTNLYKLIKKLTKARDMIKYPTYQFNKKKLNQT